MQHSEPYSLQLAAFRFRGRTPEAVRRESRLRCLASQQGMRPTHHALWFSLREPLGSLPEGYSLPIVPAILRDRFLFSQNRGWTLVDGVSTRSTLRNNGTGLIRLPPVAKTKGQQTREP